VLSIVRIVKENPLPDAPLRDEVPRLGGKSLRERRRIAVNDRLELGERGREDLGRIRVSAEGHLDDRETERPDIRCDGVGSKVVGVLACDTFGLGGAREARR
jgi:hypothetical protein